MRALVAALFLVGLVHSARADAVNWDDLEKEATQFLSDYIKIDTTNPPGNEINAARFLAERFKAEGIEAEVFESAPGRGSVLARLPGTGGARAVALVNHLDVVPANPSEWNAPPFEGVQRGAHVYGRGAIDCKGVGVVDAMTLVVLKRAGIPLKRDVIFLGTADEEAGGKMGAGWFLEHHFDRIRDVEFVLNEGGHIHVGGNGRRVYEVAVAEKTPCWLKLTAEGQPGHGSAPARQTAVTRLLAALQRVQTYKPELRVTQEVQAYFSALAEQQVGERRDQFKDLRSALAVPSFREQFLGDGHNAALVFNTLTPTVLHASPKTNVIPRSASAELDCRLLPGEDPDAFVAKIRKLINDADIKLEVLLNFPPSSSPTNTALYEAIQAHARRDGSPIVPSVLTGFTDSHYFRDKGIASYGFVPLVLTDGDTLGEHGINERIATSNLVGGTRRTIELLQLLDER